MPNIEKHAPGSFCWIELATTDQNAAKGFYAGIFDWVAVDFPMGPDEVYTMFNLDGHNAAAAYRLKPEMQSQGIPPHWMLYVTVANADETAARMPALGGKLMKEPFDVFDAGRMAVIQDPTGAAFCLWQANKHIGAQRIDEVNTLCWSELLTTDKPKALEFYSKLFGWTMKTNPSDPNQYTEFSNQGKPIGGIMQIRKEMGNMPSNWSPYFMVASVDDIAAKAQQSGATLRMPPTDIPNTGRFASIADPQGAGFSIFQPAAR